MIRKLPPALFAFLVAPGCTFATFGDGVFTEDVRSVPAFTSVATNIPLNTRVIAAPDDVVVACDTNIAQLIHTTVSNGVLTISSDSHGALVSDFDCAVTASAPEVVGVSAQGSGDVSIGGGFDLAALSVEGQGSGDISLDGLTVTQLSVQHQGSGDVEGDGSSDLLVIDATGSGDTEFGDWTTIDAEVSLAGSGDVELFATGSVTGSLTGSGDLEIDGGATVDVAVSGSGEISEP